MFSITTQEWATWSWKGMGLLRRRGDMKACGLWGRALLPPLLGCNNNKAFSTTNTMLPTPVVG